MLRRLAVFASGTILFGVIPAVPASAATYVTSNISTNTTWTPAGNPYIITSTVGVLAGATLTIEPGVVVQLGPLTTSLSVSGTLHAVGTEAQHITFTSTQDDGGSGGAPGQWSSLRFTNYSFGTLDYVDMRYGGWGTACQSSSLLSVLYDANVSVDHSIFEKSDTSGIEATNRTNRMYVNHSLIRLNPCGFVGAGRVGVTMTNSTVSRNGTGVLLNLGSSTVTDSLFTSNNVVDNTGNGFQLQVASSVPANLYPSATGNNIHGNGDNPPYKDVYTLYKRSDIVPKWDGNYFGDDVYPELLPCPWSPSWQLHVTNIYYPLSGPINSTTYYMPGNSTIKCAADNLAVYSISPVRVDNEAPDDVPPP